MRKTFFGTFYDARISDDSGMTTVNGIRVGLVFNVVQIHATIQPLTARELLDLPEGLRSRARYACQTFTALKAHRPGGPHADQVTVDGLHFEVYGGFDDGRFPGAPIGGYDYILVEPELAQ